MGRGEGGGFPPPFAVRWAGIPREAIPERGLAFLGEMKEEEWRG